MAAAIGLLRAMRPEQWLKNGFVFAPLIFSGLVGEPFAWLRTGAAALAFCAAASATYLVNDILDRTTDRAHPTKRLRPIASGAVAVWQALAAATILLAAAITGAIGLGPWFATVVSGYVVLTVLYSFVLKHMVFIDVLVLATGFLLRVVGGALAIPVPVSRWLLVCAYLLALYLALGKRRSELALLGDAAGAHRSVLGEYTVGMVDQAISVVLGATVVAYTLYTVAEDTVAKIGSEGLLGTVPVVLYGLFRYLYLLRRLNSGGSPTRVLITDRPLLICVALWLVVASAIITLSH